MARTKRRFGGIRKLPSGRYQANYTGPDARLHKAPSTFDAREDAEAWLTDVRRKISRGDWSAKPRRKRTADAGSIRGDVARGTDPEAAHPGALPQPSRPPDPS